MTLTYTLEFAVALTFVNIWLSIRAVQMRVRSGAMMGTAGDPRMEARMRAHANFIEYVPMALILMGVVEFHTGPARLLFWLGLALTIGRVLHPFGLERPAPNPYRMAGMALTIAPTAILAIWGVLILYGAAGR